MWGAAAPCKVTDASYSPGRPYPARENSTRPSRSRRPRFFTSCSALCWYQHVKNLIDDVRVVLLVQAAAPHVVGVVFNRTDGDPSVRPRYPAHIDAVTERRCDLAKLRASDDADCLDMQSCCRRVGFDEHNVARFDALHLGVSSGSVVRLPTDARNTVADEISGFVVCATVHEIGRAHV